MIIQPIRNLILGDPRLCGARRDPRWPQVEQEHLRLFPFCAVCGCKTNLQVHHKKPFHLFPAEELNPDNLKTLGVMCPTGNHHLLFGHLGNWSCYNANIDQDAAYWYTKIQNRDKK